MIVTNSKDFLEVLPVLKDKNKTKEVTNDTNVMILA
jgi:PTS system beta-glucosides-specific IIC component